MARQKHGIETIIIDDNTRPIEIPISSVIRLLCSPFHSNDLAVAIALQTTAEITASPPRP
ncbi:hypothetical protein NQX30_00035 [Candidatus Persebacteraceae bacterium Df01]|uniref:Uncharacterized protein n=1 Tax=Candidatus Doriopsillibacter californiensis TaxID=2970740 RepID=A0ABT7QJ77_9GAMM|nr:hypothetical protein [Candidatus Persebacteraceae bacterium Df01]